MDVDVLNSAAGFLCMNTELDASHSRDVNTTIMELLIMVYACKTSCAKSIIGVIPYFPYSKQCKMRKRGSIVSKLLASMMCKAGKNAGCEIIKEMGGSHGQRSDPKRSVHKVGLCWKTSQLFLVSLKYTQNITRDVSRWWVHLKINTSCNIHFTLHPTVLARWVCCFGLCYPSLIMLFLAFLTFLSSCTLSFLVCLS